MRGGGRAGESGKRGYATHKKKMIMRLKKCSIFKTNKYLKNVSFRQTFLIPTQ